MNLGSLPLRIVERVDKRVLGAFQLVDAATRLPILGSATVQVLGATLVDAQGETAVPVQENSVRLQRSRSGFHVIMRAPFFDAYSESFENPQVPTETKNGLLRLRFGITPGGSYYLPQQFQFGLPRSVDPAEANNVFQAVPVTLFRAPSAPTHGGWAVLRVRVTQAGTGSPLPGVLIRVFRSPRGTDDQPIGSGMTDWRDRARGEGLVPVTGIVRFRPGAGASVVETQQTIEIDVTRDAAFRGEPEELPDIAKLVAAAAATIIRPPNRPPGSQLNLLEPTAPVKVQAGHELVMRLEMP
jgi:hypothetical protein